MKQLILTKIDPASDDRQAEHLGPWSLSDVQFFGWEWEKYGIRRVLKAEDILPVSRSLEKVCEFYLHRLSRRQNERHERSCSARYWRILLMPWLCRLIMCSFERFLRIRSRIASGVPYLAYLSPRDEAPSPISTSHFNRMILDDPLNRLIFSRFLRAYEPEGWIMRDGAPAPPDEYFSVGDQKKTFVRGNYGNHAKAGKSQRKMEMYHWASILCSNLGCVQFQRVYGLGLLDSLHLSFRMMFRGRRRWKDAARSFQKIPETENEHLSKDDMIEEIEAIQGMGAEEAEIFLRVLDGLIEDTMPKIFTDEFRENERKSRRKIKATAPWTDAIVSGLVTSENDPWRFYAAGLLEDRPVRLIGSQHGGLAGMAEAISFYNLVEYKTDDRFVSWGWERQSDYEAAAPASSPLLSKMKRGAKRNSSIIMIGSALPIYSKWLATDYQPDDIGRLMKNKISFIERLKNEPRSALWYRPHATKASDRYDRAYMEERYPDLKILSGRLVSHKLNRMPSALSQCGVCVFDGLGATELFTIAAGIPAVFFWDENIWRISRQAKPHVEKLSAVGAHHSSPESAARHLNAIWPDIDSWWQDGGTQEAVKEFGHRYCRSSENWRSEWVNMFCSADSELWK